MSMLMTLLLLPTSIAPVQDAPQTDAAQQCRTPEVHRADNPMPARPIEPLNRQPLANHEKAVMYSEGKCVKPVRVRENVGTEQR